MQRERVSISLDIGFTFYRFGRDTPCIVLVSGVTKNDGCGVFVLRRVIEEIRDRVSRGTILVVPQLNECGLDFKPCFNDKGEPICRLVDKFIEVLPHHCQVVEVRCRKGFIPHIVAPKDYGDRDLRALVDAIPVEPVVKAGLRSLADVARKRGYSSVTLILSGGREFSYSEIEQGIELVLDTLSNLGLLKRRPKHAQHTYFNGYSSIRCDSRGLFIPSISSGAKITAKTAVGKLNDDPITSPTNGLVLYIANPRLCNLNEVVCVIASED